MSIYPEIEVPKAIILFGNVPHKFRVKRVFQISEKSKKVLSILAFDSCLHPPPLPLRSQHFNENWWVYKRLCLFFGVVVFWHWQCGGFGEKADFLRHFRSAAATAAAAATVADGIAAVEKAKIRRKEGYGDE